MILLQWILLILLNLVNPFENLLEVYYKDSSIISQPNLYKLEQGYAFTTILVAVVFGYLIGKYKLKLKTKVIAITQVMLIITLVIYFIYGLSSSSWSLL